MTTRCSMLCAVALAAAACAAGPTEPPAAAGRARAAARPRGEQTTHRSVPMTERAKMRSFLSSLTAKTTLEGPDRGRVRASLPVDMAALPRLPEPAASLPLSALASFRIGPAGNPIFSGGDLLAEVNAGPFRAYLPAPKDTSAPLRREPRLPLRNSTRACGTEGTTRTTVDMFRPSSWSRAAVSYSRLEGNIDWLSCEGALDRASTVRAPAVIPGLVYAFVERPNAESRSSSLDRPRNGSRPARRSLQIKTTPTSAASRDSPFRSSEGKRAPSC